MQVNDIPTATAMLTAELTQLNGGSIQWTSATDVVIAASALDGSTAFVIAAGLATLNHGGIAVSGSNRLQSSPNGGAPQTVAKAKLLKADSTIIATLTVGVSLSDINMLNTLIGTGKTCDLVGLTIAPN